MKIRTIILMFGIVFCFSLLIQNGFAQNSNNSNPLTIVFKVKTEYRTLCHKKHIDSPKLQRILNQLNAISLFKIFPNHTPPDRRKNGWNGKPLTDITLWYELKYPNSIPINKANHLLLSTDIIQYCQEKPLPNPFFIPNEDSTILATQYYLDNIRAYTAWDIDTGDTNVVIGIVDSGADWDHPDLINNIKYNYKDKIDGIDNDNDGFIDNFRGWDMADNDNNPAFPTINFLDHGTAVSSLAAASTNNSIGMSSIGFKCKFLPIKAKEDATGNYTNLYEGVVYGADHGCHIINCSWGSKETKGFYEKDIINYATVNKNALIVAAAGNDGDESVFFPASLENVLSIGNTDSDDEKSSGSNYGIYIDLCAPGTNIYLAYNGGGYGIPPGPGGTSFSAPLVAGCAGLLKSRFPELNGIQIGHKIKASADNIDTITENISYVEKLGSGRLNAYRALTDTTPSIGYISNTLYDGNDNVFNIGDTISLQATFINFLSPTINAEATISCKSSFVHFIDSTFTLGALDTLDSINNNLTPFVFYFDSNTPYNAPIELKITYTDSATNYSAFEYIGLTVNNDWVNLDINNVGTTITSESRIGYNNPIHPIQQSGIGFTYNGNQLLYDAGLMIGGIKNGIEYVSDNVLDSISVDEDFSILSVVEKITPPTIGDKFITTSFTDENINNTSLNIDVIQSSYAWNNNTDNNYVISEYRIINNNNVTLSNVYTGIYADWDIMEYSLNKISFSPAHKMGYAYSSQLNSPYVGIKLLSSDNVLHHGIDYVLGGAGGLNIYPPEVFSTHNKYAALSTNRNHAGLSGAGNDIIDVVSTGPNEIESNDTIFVAFALIAGQDLNELFESAIYAQEKYDSIYPNNDTILNNISYSNKISTTVFPNPANDYISILLNAKIDQNFVLMIANLEGKTLLKKNFTANKNNLYQVKINDLSSGLYQFSIQSTSYFKSGSFTVIKN